jgi:hypothetical protein
LPATDSALVGEQKEEKQSESALVAELKEALQK